MLIDLKSVFNTEGLSVEIKTEVDFSDVEISGSYPFMSPAKVIGKVYNRAGIVKIEASSELLYRAPCDRCACDMEKLVETSIDHVLVMELSDEDNDDFLLLDSYNLMR